MRPLFRFCLSILIGIALTAMFAVWTSATAGNLPIPAKQIWDLAFYVGVLVSGNIHQPNSIGAGAVLIILFSIASYAVIALMSRILNSRKSKKRNEKKSD